MTEPGATLRWRTGVNGSPGRMGVAWALAGVLAGCGVFQSPASLPVGASIDVARGSFGGPGAEHALPDGATRLEYRRGRDTYMLDFDAAGRFVAGRQVLDLPTFATIRPGMSEQDVLTRIGHPAFVFPVGWQQQQVWNYRFGGLEGDCFVFQVSIGNVTHRVAETGQGPDPACSTDSGRS